MGRQTCRSTAFTPQLGRREFLGTTLATCLTTIASARTPIPSGVRNRITVVLTGGASHLDLWDLKPQAPVQIRGPFRPTATSVPGLEICEHLPRLARLAHHCTLFRGMSETGPEIHDLAGYRLLLENTIQLFPGPASPEFSRNDPFNLDQFSSADCERYGRHPFGRNALLARELVRRKEADVAIHFSAGILNTLSWDMHADGGDLAVDFRDVGGKLLPQLDQGLSALLSDLEQTGLLNGTIVSVVTEMGRTPRINPRGGRDHFKGAWSNLVAGGPFVGGKILGETDSRGETVIAGAVTSEEFCRRILSH